MTDTAKATPIPLHKWTHEGDKVLALKNLPRDGKAYGGFQWPTKAGETVSAPDWRPNNECGGGLHIWFWGLGIGDGKQTDWNGLWMVVACDPSETVGNLEGAHKGKCRQCEIVLVGSYNDCMQHTIAGRIAWVMNNAGSASQTGDMGSASQTGYAGSASQTGDRGSASQTGYRGSASQTGYKGSASQTGDMGSASQTGDRGSAVSNGEECTVEATCGGCLAIGRTVFWKPHPKSVLLQWWMDDDKNQHHAVFTFCDKWKRKTVKIIEGKVTEVT